jgi:hypothetical protein
MDIEIQNRRHEALFKNGKYQFTFIPKLPTEKIKIHHMGCVGDTRLNHIQLEQGTEATSFIAPDKKVNSLSGIFKQLRDLDIQMRDPKSDLWGKIKLNNTGAILDFYNENIKTQLTTLAGKVNLAISELDNKVLKKTDVSVTSNGITIGSGNTIDGRTIASIMKVQPDSIDLISPLIRVTGNMVLDGTLEGRKIKANTLETGHHKAGSITTEILAANAVKSNNLYVDNAMIIKFLANSAFITELFAKRAFITQLQTVKVTSTQIDTESLRGKTIIGADIIGGTITGRSKIVLGEYGYMQPTESGGLQINSPHNYTSKDGVGIQIVGGRDRGKDVPYGMFIYQDSDFTVGGNTPVDTDSYLLTVKGYINTKGVNNLKFTNYTDGSTSIGVWNKNVDLLFDSSANDIFYDYANSKYSLWEIIKSHFDTTSDVRLKTDIVNSKTNALNKLELFSFKSFNWKERENFGTKPYTDIGLIAQDVEKIDNNFVKMVGEYMTLDHFNLLTFNLKATQELYYRDLEKDKKLIKLEERIKQMEEKLYAA